MIRGNTARRKYLIATLSDCFLPMLIVNFFFIGNDVGELAAIDLYDWNEDEALCHVFERSLADRCTISNVLVL